MCTQPGWIGKRYPSGDKPAVHTRTGDRMEQKAEWASYLHEICYPVERFFLGYPVKDKERLVSAIISNAFLNEKIEFEQLRKIPADKSLETIGDYVLDFAILEHVPGKESATPKAINDFREFYGKNETLHWFAKNRIHLQNFILWGPDEESKKRWDDPATDLLAARFEMLIGVIYLEKAIAGVKAFLEKHNFFREIEKFKKTI
jgi:dsRNA-specific ribonuclease